MNTARSQQRAAQTDADPRQEQIVPAAPGRISRVRRFAARVAAVAGAAHSAGVPF